MNVLILSGDINLKDEGMMIICKKILQGLTTHSSGFFIQYVIAKNLLHPQMNDTIRILNPRIIHCILRPSVIVLLLLFYLHLKFRNSIIILSALQPPLHKALFTSGLKFFKPDLVLVQTKKMKDYYQSCGCKTDNVIGTIDLEKFHPLPEKSVLRQKYNLPPDKYIVLHVGHIKKKRNIKIFCNLQDMKDVQVVIVGSTAFNPEISVINELKRKGCIIFYEYFNNIEEIYNAADCYVFPTIDESNCVEIPLSVIEALAVNLPVVSTPFGGLPEIFNNGEGIFFDDNPENFNKIISKLKTNRHVFNSRSKLENIDWKTAINQLSNIYQRFGE